MFTITLYIIAEVVFNIPNFLCLLLTQPVLKQILHPVTLLCCACFPSFSLSHSLCPSSPFTTPPSSLPCFPSLTAVSPPTFTHSALLLSCLSPAFFSLSDSLCYASHLPQSLTLSCFRSPSSAFSLNHSLCYTSHLSALPSRPSITHSVLPPLSHSFNFFLNHSLFPTSSLTALPSLSITHSSLLLLYHSSVIFFPNPSPCPASLLSQLSFLLPQSLYPASSLSQLHLLPQPLIQ